MSIKQSILTYILTTPVFFIIDLIWLGLVAQKMYQKYLSDLLASKVNWIPALLFYFAYIGGIIIFAVNPAIEKNSATKALMLGALFGFLAYSTYDLTNLATLKNWPLEISIIDIIWGTLLTGTVAVISYFIARQIL